MTKDDIIRMALEAGFNEFTGGLRDDGSQDTFLDCWPEQLERFFHMAQAAEREAIAQMVEDTPALIEFVKNDKGGCMVCGFTPKMAAAAIRARGQA